MPSENERPISDENTTIPAATEPDVDLEDDEEEKDDGDGDEGDDGDED